MSIPTEPNNVLINQLIQHFVGLVDNDGTGEMLRRAFIKVNENLELMLTRVGFNKTDFITEKLDTLEVLSQDILSPVTYTHRVTLKDTGISTGTINKPIDLVLDLKGRSYSVNSTNLQDGDYPHVSLLVSQNRVLEVRDNTPNVIKPDDRAGGDLDLTYPNPIVVGFREVEIDTTPPTIQNQVYAYDGIRWSLATLSNLIGPANGDVTGPYLNNRVVRFQGRNVSSSEPGPFNVYIWDNSVAQWVPRRYITSVTAQDVADKLPNMGGDVTGPYNTNTVSGVQGRSITNTNPSTNQALRWDGDSWVAANIRRPKSNVIVAPPIIEEEEEPVTPPAPPPPSPTSTASALCLICTQPNLIKFQYVRALLPNQSTLPPFIRITKERTNPALTPDKITLSTLSDVTDPVVYSDTVVAGQSYKYVVEGSLNSSFAGVNILATLTTRSPAPIWYNAIEPLTSLPSVILYGNIPNVRTLYKVGTGPEIQFASITDYPNTKLGTGADNNHTNNPDVIKTGENRFFNLTLTEETQIITRSITNNVILSIATTSGSITGTEVRQKLVWLNINLTSTNESNITLNYIIKGYTNLVLRRNGIIVTSNLQSYTQIQTTNINTLEYTDANLTCSDWYVYTITTSTSTVPLAACTVTRLCSDKCYNNESQLILSAGISAPARPALISGTGITCPTSITPSS